LHTKDTAQQPNSSTGASNRMCKRWK